MSVGEKGEKNMLAPLPGSYHGKKDAYVELNLSVQELS